MTQIAMDVIPDLRAVVERIMTTPTSADLWKLHTYLLVMGGEEAQRARSTAGVFHSYLQDLESKISSRQASRLAAALATAAVSSVSLQELLVERERPLQRLLGSIAAAMLEIGSATQSVRAWEIETSLVHYEAAWYLYGELWDISLVARPELSWQERRAFAERLMLPMLSRETPGAVKAMLLIRLFQAVLMARLLPLLTAQGHAGDSGAAGPPVLA
ncbi:MAG: hypothetical protein N2508_14180 [Anaerolineae bacterium]|nr:hypothetical protein [Anaerolineae bacterium]